MRCTKMAFSCSIYLDQVRVHRPNDSRQASPNAAQSILLRVAAVSASELNRHNNPKHSNKEELTADSVWLGQFLDGTMHLKLEKKSCFGN